VISFKSAPRVLSKLLSLPAKLTTSSRAGGTASPSTKKSFSMPSVLKGLGARAKPISRQSNPVKLSQVPYASETGHREDMVKDAIAYMKGPTAPAANRPRRFESGLGAQVEARFQALKGGPLPSEQALSERFQNLKGGPLPALKTLFERADALAKKGPPIAAPTTAADDGLTPLLLARFEALKARSPAPPGPAAASETPPDLHAQVQALRKRFYPAPSSRAAPPPATRVPKYTKAEAQALGLKVPNRAPPAPPSFDPLGNVR
jgi:hypothetical protein